MFRAPSSNARRDMTVNMVVPTSGNLLVKRKGLALQRLQSAGERTHRKAVSAQFARRRQASFARGAYQQEFLSCSEQSGIRQQNGHGNVPRCGRPGRKFFLGSDVDDFEPAPRRFSQRGQGNLDSGFLSGYFPDMRTAGGAALGAARGL